MTLHQPDFHLQLAQSSAELRAAQRLRYQVFVEELGGDGALVDHEARLEQDEFDPYFDHLLLTDRALPGTPCVGVYRLLRDDQAAKLGRYYSEDEYDLTRLRDSGRKLLELGRSCVHPDYRGGTALAYLWRGLSAYVDDHGTEVLFGVASFHGTDVTPLRAPLSMLHHRHLAPEPLRVRAQPKPFQRMDLMDESDVDRVAAMKATPSLIKAYLRLGGFVGEGAFIDHAFNTTDVCLILDTALMSDKQRTQYRQRARK